MDITKLIRDPIKIHETLSEQGDKLITTKGCKIYTPVLYEEKGLLSIGTEITILGIFDISVDDKYNGVSLAPTMLRIEPSTINTVDINGDKYYEFVFLPGSVVIADLMAVKDDTLPYHIYDLFIASGKIPFYFTYSDLGDLFSLAEYQAGIKIGANNAVMEMIVAVISRTESDRTKYYRHEISKIADQHSNPPVYIPFSDVSYNATNTTARLIGSYYDQGVTSALINPSQRTENIETILRR